MSLMTDMLRQSIANSGVSVRVGDSRNTLTEEEKYARNTDYEQKVWDGLGHLADDVTSGKFLTGRTWGELLEDAQSGKLLTDIGSGKLLTDTFKNVNPLWLFPVAQPGLVLSKVAEYTNPGAVDFDGDKGFLGNVMEGFKLGGRVANSGFGQLLEGTAGTVGYGIHRVLPDSGLDNTVGALTRAVGDYGDDMLKRNDPHIKNPNNSPWIDAANIVNEAVVSLPNSVGLALAGAGIGGAVVKGGAAALRGLPQAASAVERAAKLTTAAGDVIKNLPAVGKVAKQIGLPSPQNVIGGISSGFLEGSMEGYEGYKQYIADAKRNGTYVEGKTEEEANRVADAIAKSNFALLAPLNTAEQMLLFGKGGRGVWKRLLGIVGTAGQEGFEEAAQQVIQNQQLAKEGNAGWNDYTNLEAWKDPGVGHSALVGMTMGGGMSAMLGGGADTEDAPAANNAPTLTSGNAEIDDAIVSAAAKHGLPADLLFAVAQTESDFDQSSVSSAGAKGVMQLMPDTAASLGVDADDMVQNIEGGARYLKGLLDTFGGNVEMALAAYNAGPVAVKKYKGVPPYEETQNYVKKIMGILDGANMNPASEGEPARSLIDDAAPFIGTRMVNGAEGCVEAVTKIGAAGSDFLRAELDAGVVNVDRLVEDAGERVIPFDPSKLEEGDVIVYGDNTDSQKHVVLYDGKGGYIGNSFKLELVVHRDDYNAMKDLYPTKIIKSGGRYGGASNIPSVSGSVRSIDYSGLIVDAKNLEANTAAMKALIEGDKLTPAQKEAILDAAALIRDTPTEESTQSPGEDVMDYNAWQQLIDNKDVRGIFEKNPKAVTRMVMQGEALQRKAQTAAAIENQQKIAQAQAQSVQAKVQAAAQARTVANPAESAARLASVQQELSMPPMAQQEIATRLASYAQTMPHGMERAVIQNGLAQGDFAGIARMLPEVYRAAAGRWMSQPQVQPQAQPQAQPQPQPQSQAQPQPAVNPAQQNMQAPNAQPSDLGVRPSQGLTAQNPQQPQVQAIPSAEDLTDIRQKLAALDTMMQGNPAYVEARRRGDWQTAAREAEKAGHHDLARVYQMLHEKMTGAPLNVTPYQNPAAKAGDEQGAARPTPAPVPVHPVDSLHPVDIPKSVGARRDFGRGLIKAMRMRNIPVVDTLKEGLRDGKKDALKHALKRIAQADEEDAILRGETAAQRANDGDEAQAEPREKQGDEVQAKSAQNTEGNADDHMEWIAAHPFRYDDAKSMEENIRDAEALAQEYLDAFGTTDQINTPERQELRRKIADKLYGEGAAKKEGKVWLVLGVPASGKSTFSDPLVEKEGALLIDSDEAKKLLPEFSNGLLAGAVHEESAAIANAIVKRAVRNRDNLILPLVGKTFSSLQERVNVLKEAGYEVNLIYVDLPIEKAIERTKARFRETGRLVSPNYLHNVGLKPKQNYDKIKTKREVDSYEAWSNDVHYGDNPIPLENSTEGMLETKSRMGGRRQLDSDVRSGSETSDKGTQHRGTPINTANRSDNQGGFSTPKKSVQAKSAPLTKQEQEALTGTSEEAKEAYRIVRDKLAKSKNKAVVRAAKVGATLFARHADIYAKAYSKATGKPYTALDYLHDKFGLDADGKEADGRADGLGQRTSADVPASQKEAVRKQYAGTALWMKAPNGKATNLTEDQWLTVRTPAFKAWFGDWEQVARLMLPRQAENLDKAASAARLVVGKDLTNSALGIHAILSNTNIAKMVSASATRKSVDAKIHALAVANVDHLFSRATAEYTHKDRDNDRNIKQIHRLFSPFVVGGKVFSAELTVKELAQEKEGNRLYSVEALEIKEASRKWNAAYNATEGVLTSFPQEAFDNIIARFLSDGKNCSKVVDENGEPLVVYHATLSDFTKFRPSESGLYGRGIYLTADKEDTSYTLKDKDWRVMELFANIRNPRDPEAMASQEDIDAAKKEALDFFEKHPFDKDGTPASFVVNNLLFWGMQPGKVKKSKLTQVLQDAFARKGVAYQESDKHDGAIIQRDGATWYTADQPNQVKSATGNTGAFSAADEDIYNQRAWHGTPYYFKYFDLGAIGTGEGAQVHGWGLYFAEAKGTAMGYRSTLSEAVGYIVDYYGDRYYKTNEGWLFNEEGDEYGEHSDFLDYTDPMTKALDAFHEYGDAEAAIKSLEKELEETSEYASESEIEQIKGAIEILQNDGSNMELKDPGTLFEVEIPDNDVLLDEQKPFDEQPEKVQEALGQIAEEVASQGEGSPGASFAERYQEMDGREIYEALADITGSPEDASALLNKHGVEGITYDGRQDGRCFVVFDDEAIEIINKFNQRMNDIRKGSITPQASGRRVISLFEKADESTFLHEMGHMFLMDLEDVAALDEASAEDLETVRDWAAWQEGQAEEYEDTPWQKEFAEREKAILQAKKSGDAVSVRKLKREWEQERFARGFERYLETGKAPTSVLQRIFQTFKKFLKRIYQAFKGTGGKASPEVEAVMGRMIAEDAERASGESEESPVQAKSAPIQADFSSSKIKGWTGKTTAIVTDSGEEIPVRYRLVEAKSLVTSNNAKTFLKNPAYPKSLQPRDRERANMQQQIVEMTSRLRPEDLAESRSANLGAPVVRADGVVLNGNGRAIAITRALLGNTFRDSAGAGYRAFLKEHAKEFGFKPKAVSKMRAPMLVREITAGLTKEQVEAVTTSTTGGSRLGASEQAKQDAEKITLEDLSRYEENERGDLTTAANRGFVSGILYHVSGKNDVNAYTDAKGQVNADGIQRVKRALFQKAYGDDHLLSRMSESTDDDTRNITNGLTIAAPYIARANEKMARGTAHGHKIGETIADAVKRYNHLHDIGQSVEGYLDQQAMFAEHEDSPEMREVLRVLNENRRSGKRIAQFVRRVGEIAEEQGNPNEISLMEGGEPLSLGDIIEIARKKFAEEEASRTALVHEAETLYQQAAERFPGIQDKEVASHVREAIQTTLDFGSLDGEIRAVAGNIYQDANGATFSLFGNGGGARSAVRNPSAREIQRQEIKAQKRGKIYGLGITRALVNDGAVSLVGQKAESPAALAEIAQVLRHPGYEKFHIVYTNANGAVVYHETVSARLPHRSVINAPEDEKGAVTSKDVLQNMHKRIEANLRKTGADKFYYIHNHPSGNPKPSAEDIQVTKQILDIKNRTNERAFAGHVVLDHNKYAVIDESLRVGEFRLKNKTPMTFEAPEKTHPALGITISHPNDTSRIAEMCAADAETVAFHLTPQLVVRGVQKIHDDFKKKSWGKQMRYLRHCARIAGGTRIVLATSNRMLFEFGKADINNGRESGILDIVFMQDGRAIETGNNVGGSVMDRPNWFGLDMDDVESQRLLEPTRQYGVSLDTLFQEAPALKKAAIEYGATEKDGEVTFESPEREKDFKRIAEALQGDVAKKLSAAWVGSETSQEALSKVLKEVELVAPEKLTRRQQGIADFGKAMGMPVVFFKGVTNLHGFHASNSVTFLNTESETSLSWTFWHEALHWMKANNEELFGEIIEDVEKAGAFTKAQLDGYRKEIGAPELSDAEAIEEMLADALPDVKRRVPFMKNLGKRNKSLAERFVGWIREVMDRFRDFFHTPARGLTKAQSAAMRDAFAALARDMVDERGRRIFRVDGVGRRITLANGAPLPSAKYSLDNREGRGDNEDRISKAVFDKHLNDGIMTMVEERVRKEIGEHVDFVAMSDPVARDAARDGLPYIKKMLVQYNIIKAQKMNPAYADRYAVMIEYARRCFDNDSRVGREAARGLGQNDGQGRMDSTGNENHAEPNVGRSAERGGRSTLGLSRSVSGEKSGARAHFERLYEDMKKHPETGAFSMVKFSRNNRKPGSLGLFRRLLVGLKLGEEAVENLEVHRSNKEKQLVIPASKLNKFMVDKALTEKNILKTEDVGNGNIRVTYMPQDFHNIHILDWLKSVRQLRKKNPFVKAIYDLGSRAMHLQEHLRNEGVKTVKEFNKLTKNENDRKLVTDILLEGDAAGQEYSVQELRAMGANENVIRAYKLVRKAMKEWYKRINDARMQIQTRTKTLSKNDLDDFKKNHWIQDSDVLSVQDKGGGNVLLTWRGGKTYETKDKVMTKAELDALIKDKDVRVAHFHKLGNSYGVENYSVDYVERIKPLGNLTGYMPHFFHEWMIYEKHKDPQTGEVRLTTIGSGRSLNDAVRLGNDIARKNSDKEYVVRPKGFDLQVENSVVIGDADFQQMAAKIAEGTQMTLADANAFLRDSAGATMRARHRFFGNAMHRTGAKGFDTDVTYMLTHYFNTSARYIAMEQFKPRAVTLYERWFGAFDADPKDDTAKYVKGLIKDINGDPRPLEKAVSELIMKTPIGRMISDAYGDRAALAVNGELSTWNAISKLGLGNFSSAAVNLSQFINIGAAMNDYGYAAKGLESAIHPTAADMKILEESGVLDEMNQATDNGGYTQRRFGRVGSVYGAFKRVGEISLLPFQYADVLMRKAAILGAYKQGVEKLGLTHEEAMERAREINADTNFDYSSANAPLMIRAGSVVTQQMFQFQKYPIMQMEFMYNILKEGTMGQKVRFLLPYILMCGIPGTIPFGTIFNQIFSFLFGLATGDDKDIGDEIKAEALRWAGKDATKKAIVNTAIYGVLAPTFGIDVSKRIGISGAFSGEFFGAQKPESVGGMLAMQLGGPMANTAVNMSIQMHNRNPIEALKAFSPAFGNMAQAAVGVSRTTRHRVKSRYETTYDRIIHAMGFRSVDESNNSFITSYEFDRKDAETHAKQEAIMDYIDDPSEANRQRINALGIKDKAIEEARIQQERSATERAKDGSPKVKSGKTSKRRTTRKKKEEKPKKETLFDLIEDEDDGM